MKTSNIIDGFIKKHVFFGCFYVCLVNLPISTEKIRIIALKTDSKIEFPKCDNHSLASI